MKTTVNIRLITNGAEQNVVLNKQIANVDAIYLDEVLATGWNGGVATGAYLRFTHPQLRDASIPDNGREGTLLLVDPLNPHETYSNKLLATGSASTLNSFGVSVKLPTGAPVLFTELYLILTVVSRAPAAGAYQRDAQIDWPQTKGADPRQSKFMY